MRSPRGPVLLALLLSPISGASSWSADGTCGGFDDLSPEAEIALGTIARARVNFIHTSSHSESCPSAAPRCRQQAYLVKGDEVVVSGRERRFVCAVHVGPNRRMAVGWLPADAVVRRAAEPPVRIEDWVGDWRFDLRAPRYRAQAFTIIRAAADPSKLHIDGNANYAESTAAAQRGSVNTGTIVAEAAPTGASLAFAVGDVETLPYDHPGGEGTCRIRMRRLGRHLLASDNGKCGGLNVTFWGVYRRAKPR